MVTILLAVLMIIFAVASIILSIMSLLNAKEAEKLADEAQILAYKAAILAGHDTVVIEKNTDTISESLKKAVDAFKKTSFCPAGAEYDESCGLFKVDGVFDMMTQRFWEAYRLGWKRGDGMPEFEPQFVMKEKYGPGKMTIPSGWLVGIE